MTEDSMNEVSTPRTAKIIELLREKVRLEPNHRRLFYAVFGILWASGFIWLLAEWFKDPELGDVRTLLQTASMKLHGAAMLVYLAMFGSLMTHIRRGTALKANRFSGFLIIAINGALVLTGWLLYYLTDETLRQWSSTIHWTVGVSSLVLLAAHIWIGRNWAARVASRDKPSQGNRIDLRSWKRKDNRRQCG
jgi:hypothetical protein